ncbi:MAG TPA: sulfatase-like hydrolase/transferase [Thermoanaerobaculia bacterium]|nr:sulfatase-like hydrolase/transferase [Thermoanaerobaculia bacterium]
MSDTDGRARPGLLRLAPGFLWAGVLFGAFGFLVEPRPESAAQVAILFFLAIFLGCLHAGVFAAAAALAGRAGRAADALLALAGGLAYGWLALSILKFSKTRAHLRSEDLWFLATSARQVSGEGTSAERGLLALAIVLPLAIALGLYVLLRVARRHRAPTPVAFALALAVVGVVGLAAVGWRYPAARWALTTLLPDSRAAVQLARAALGPEPRADWEPDPGRQARLDAGGASAPAERWNVLVVMLESVPWKRLLGPEARPESTPRLLELARDSVVFERAYALSTHSDYAQTSILGSSYPRRGDTHDYFFEIDYPRALPWDVLAPHGYRTLVDSTQNENWGNMIAFLTTPALETLRHAPDFADAPRRGEGSQTKIFEQTVVEDFLAWVAEAPDRPFAAYLNFQATHYPYVWPDGFEPPYGPATIDFPTTFLSYPREETGVMLDRFHNALAYVDLWTGRLVDGLRARGVWDRTVVIVVADHGESFHEHGLVTHGTTLLEEQLRIPLWIRIPGRAPGVVTEPVSGLDALPSVYRLMGLSRDPVHQGADRIFDPDYSASGRPLFASLQGMTHEDAVLLDGWKWIFNLDRRDGALFDLGSDPHESRNLILVEPDRRVELERILGAFLDRQLGYYRARAWESGWGPPRTP